MSVWLRWRLCAPVLALVMALAPLVCVLHCQFGAQAQMAHGLAQFAGQRFTPDCGVAHAPASSAPLNDIQQTYEQVTQALAPAGVAFVCSLAPAQTRVAVLPILRGMAPSPEVPPPKIKN
jgi:hypothetical protein